jgi:hypothetical protein
VGGGRRAAAGEERAEAKGCFPAYVCVKAARGAEDTEGELEKGGKGHRGRLVKNVAMMSKQ